MYKLGGLGQLGVTQVINSLTIRYYSVFLFDHNTNYASSCAIFEL